VLTLTPANPTIFVIDTSAVIHRIHFAAENIQLATTPLLEEEMHKKGLKDLIDLLISTKKLKIIEPTTASLQRIRKVAAQLGDLKTLSEQDQHLLALALDLRERSFHPIVVTDDYSIQNVAKELDLEIKSMTQRGIREVIQWETYCNACGHKDPSLTKGDPCPVCASPLKRRAIRKKTVDSP
jgi:UPF0271 protein